VNLRFNRLGHVLALLALAACAGCGATSEQVVPMPAQDVEVSSPELCRIYVVRSSQLLGSIRTLTIYDQEREIGSLSGDEFLCWEREPGRMLLRAVYEGPEIDRGDQEDLLDVIVAPGEVRHFFVGLRKESEHTAEGKKRGSPLFEALSSEEGRSMVRDASPAKQR